MVATDMRTHVRNSFKDNNSTVLGFTAADGCMIAASKLRMTNVTGFDPLSKDTEDVTDEERYARVRKRN
jgi:hypothetical protein